MNMAQTLGSFFQNIWIMVSKLHLELVFVITCNGCCNFQLSQNLNLTDWLQTFLADFYKRHKVMQLQKSITSSAWFSGDKE